MRTNEDFRDAMRGAGLEFDGEIVADGKLHRFKARGDRGRNSWYVLYAGPPAAGAFGCWKRDIKKTWHERNGQLSETELSAVRRRWQEAERERERIESERHAKARKTAGRVFSRSSPVTSHPYLTAKGVKAKGDVREYHGALVVPLRDTNGELQTLQFIDAAGAKRFLTGGQIAGCFFVLSDQPDCPLVLCEGYATGASISEATGFAVVSAMNCGNLLAVAQALRNKWPLREIVIAADNDQFTDGNPGMTRAIDAAKGIHAKLAVPRFPDVSAHPTDFNDLAKLEGLDALRQQIEDANPQRESDEETLQRLAALPVLEYERQRENAAQTLGCRTSSLDKLVDAKRPKRNRGKETLQGSTIDFADVELWPEVVDGDRVLNALASTFARYIVLPDGAADVLALCAPMLTPSMRSFAPRG